MPRDLIQFPPRHAAPAESSGPAMYMRYEVNGAVRRYDMPDQLGPGLPEPSAPPASLAQARRIAQDVEQEVALNPRLHRFDPSQPPQTLQPKCYGAGLFLVPGGTAGVRLLTWPATKTPSKPQTPPQASLLRKMGRIFASSVRTAGSVPTLFSR